MDLWSRYKGINKKIINKIDTYTLEAAGEHQQVLKKTLYIRKGLTKAFSQIHRKKYEGQRQDTGHT